MGRAKKQVRDDRTRLAEDLEQLRRDNEVKLQRADELQRMREALTPESPKAEFKALLAHATALLERCQDFALGGHELRIREQELVSSRADNGEVPR
jgi:hypothetical protein